MEAASQSASQPASHQSPVSHQPASISCSNCNSSKRQQQQQQHHQLHGARLEKQKIQKTRNGHQAPRRIINFMHGYGGGIRLEPIKKRLARSSWHGELQRD